jgi:hypothetical protein
LNIVQIVLSAFRAAEPNTKIILPADSEREQRTYSTINPKSKNTDEIKKIEQLVFTHNNGTIQGNISITSSSKYSTIKKNVDAKKILQYKFKITTNINDINAKNISEVEFFTHHLVRHETAECRKWITQVLPQHVPPEGFRRSNPRQHLIANPSQILQR